jgi:DNA-binding NtrC family response regulator
MRQRILVVAQDMTLRSTLARWLMSAGYYVELAEGEKRAREVLADNRIALTILAGGRPGMPTFDLNGSCNSRILVTEPVQHAVRPSVSAHLADGSPAIPLDEQAVLASVKSALQPQPDGPDARCAIAAAARFH